jgi:micrococcal nuclease
MYEYKAVVTRVVDGDTLEVAIDLGFSITHTMKVRLAHIDAYESYGANACDRGRQAKKFTEDWVAAARSAIVIQTLKDEQDKYGRYLGVISVEPDLPTLNKSLLDAGLAVPYEGGKKTI